MKNTFKTRRILSLFVAIIAVLTTVPASLFSVFAVDDIESAEVDNQVYQVSEIVEKRGEFEKHYKMSDGTIKAITYAEPIHYMDSTGNWQEIDNTLTLNTSGTGYISTSGDFSVELGGTSKMTDGLSSIEWGIKTVTDTGKVEIGAITSPVKNNMGLSAKSAKLSNINAGVMVSTDKFEDVKAFSRVTVSHPEESVILSSNVVKGKVTQNLTVLNSDDFNGYQVTYKLNGLTPVINENNGVELNNSTGSTEYAISPLLIIDADGNTIDDYTVSLTNVNDTATLTYNIEETPSVPFTLIAVITSSSYTSCILDTTKIQSESGGSSTLPWLYVGYANYSFSSAPGATVKTRYTTYIKFSQLPTIDFNNSLDTITSIKLRFKPSTADLTEENLTECSPAIFAANPFRMQDESQSQCPYTSLASSSYVRHNIESDAHNDMTFDSDGYNCYFDITNLITDYDEDSMFYAIDYTDITDNTDKITTFFSNECQSSNNMPALEVLYCDITEYNYMILNQKSDGSGKYLDVDESGAPTLTVSNEYKRENLWSFQFAGEVNSYYIRTSESLYLNDAYGSIANLPSSFDIGIKYLGLNNGTFGVTNNATAWKIDIATNGTFLIYKTEGGVNYYLCQGSDGLSVTQSISNSDAYWSFERCDIISGKVYTIKTMAADKYVSVFNGYDHSETDLTMEDTTNREAYNHQTFRIEYMPQYDAYKFRTMVSMNGWYRPIDVKRSSGNPNSGYGTQIFNDSVDGLNGNEACQLFKITSVDNTVGVSYIEWIDITGQYLVYNNNDVMVTSINEIDQNNCTWLLEEYTKYYEEYYKSLCWEFPVKDGSGDSYTDVPWEFISSKAYRNISNGSSDHAGIDVSFNVNTLLTSPFEGKIVYYNTQITSARGYYVVIESNHYVCGKSIKLKVLLQHLNEPVNSTIPDIPNVNQLSTNPYYVDTDTVVGKVGGSGLKFIKETSTTVPSLNAYDYHLHYAVIIDGLNTSNFSNSIDPLLFHQRNTFEYS